MSRVEQLASACETKFAGRARVVVTHHEVTLEVEPDHLLAVMHTLHDDEAFAFKSVMDICGVDYLHYGVGEWETTDASSTGFCRGVDTTPPPSTWDKPRFAVVYHLLSVPQNQRVRVVVYVPEDNLMVESVEHIWPVANWNEREVYDLFGIVFNNNSDLRRILTDYGFIGHPFRKDFPLIGEVEVRYDATEARVVYDPVDLRPRTLVPKVVRYTAEEHPDE